MIQASDYVAAGKELLELASKVTIPYVPNSSNFSQEVHLFGAISITGGLDCQGLCEYLLAKCGIQRNWSGSNDMARHAVQWFGTIAECNKVFGHVPPGAWLFIVKEDDSSAPAKYHGDGVGDASHVGVYLGGETAIHASSSREKVAESTFKGKAINGGWSHVGLPLDIEFTELNENTQFVKEWTPMRAKVFTPDGGSVNVRFDPSTKKAYAAKLPAGTLVNVIAKGDEWSSIDMNGKTRYIMTKFLSFEDGFEDGDIEGVEDVDEDADVKTQLIQIIASLKRLVDTL